MDYDRQRRFGPVTLLALAGGVTFGLVSVIIVRALFMADIVHGRADTPRAILVTSITAGVMLGIGLGMLVEAGKIRMPSSADGRRLLFAAVCGLAVMGLSFFLAAWAMTYAHGSGGGRLVYSAVRMFLIQQAQVLPLICVWVVGMYLAVLRWKLHPKASKWLLFGLIGFALSLIGTFGFSVVTNAFMLNSAGRSSFNGNVHFVQLAYLGWNVVRATIQAASLACLLIAVFAGRMASVDKADSFPKSQR